MVTLRCKYFMRQSCERIVSNLRPLQAEVDDQWDQNLRSVTD